MKTNWYRADFEVTINGEKHYPDAEYYTAESDAQAIEIAQNLAKNGWDYADVVEHVNGELMSVVLVDADNEFVDIKTIWG